LKKRQGGTAVQEYREKYSQNCIAVILSAVLFLVAGPCHYGKIAIAAEHVADEHTLLLLHFNDSLQGTSGETPTEAAGVIFETGIFGLGAFFGPDNQLYYNSLANIDETAGTLEFWLKPRWSVDDGQDHYALRFGDGGGMLFGKDGGNYWRSILNRYSPGGVSEQGAGLYVND
jgi:hypothetical protein